MKAVLVTGGSGFIGRPCLRLLVERGYEVHAVSSKRRPVSDGVAWHTADLLDCRQIRPLIEEVKPSHLLHLAWYVIPGKSATHSDNFLWVQSSLELCRAFGENGGTRIVIAGSSFEYDWRFGYCSEGVTPTVPNTYYGECKLALWALMEAYCAQKGLSSAWPRIFFLYGPHEHSERLVPSVIASLIRGEPARCSHGRQIRDYLYVEDVASAMAMVLDSDIRGPVNVGSGHPVALKDIVLKIATKIGREELVQLGALPTRPTDSPLILADIRRLTTELDWRAQYDLDRGLDETIQWWRRHLTPGDQR